MEGDLHNIWDLTPLPGGPCVLAAHGEQSEVFGGRWTYLGDAFRQTRKAPARFIPLGNKFGKIPTIPPPPGGPCVLAAHGADGPTSEMHFGRLERPQRGSSRWGISLGKYQRFPHHLAAPASLRRTGSKAKCLGPMDLPRRCISVVVVTARTARILRGMSHELPSLTLYAGLRPRSRDSAERLHFRR